MNKLISALKQELHRLPDKKDFPDKCQSLGSLVIQTQYNSRISIRRIESDDEGLNDAKNINLLMIRNIKDFKSLLQLGI